MTPQLPELVINNGSWEDYRERLYATFHSHFIDSVPMLNGLKVVLGNQNIIEGKENVFWHIIQKGENEEERSPDFRRCERIGWIRFIIENADNDDIKVWEVKRGTNTRVCLSDCEWEYLVVLAKQRTHYVLITAYPIDYSSAKRRCKKEFTAFQQNPPNDGRT
ncbi:MAG: hypothetical protein KAS32_06275 [Candidatus Peribacteraceae bacterium]|nr:hypothetical protein [Candidatus Peribacteraceae bacterium]